MNSFMTCSLTGRISHITCIIAFAVIFIIMTALGNSGPIENNFIGEQTPKFVAPVEDSGDANVRNLPIVLSRTGVRVRY